MKTLYDHFIEASLTYIEPPLQNKSDEFEETHGRKRLPGEPDEGFRVPLFKPTKDDDGTVVLDGFVFPQKKEEVNQVFDHDFWTFYKDKSRYISQFTRDEFFERARHGFNLIEGFAAVEQFFGKKLPTAALEQLAEVLSGYKIGQCSNKKTGEPCLIAGGKSLFESQSDNYVGADRFFVVAASKKDYNAFVGKLLLGGTLIPQKNGETERE